MKYGFDCPDDGLCGQMTKAAVFGPAGTMAWQKTPCHLSADNVIDANQSVGHQLRPSSSRFAV
jgi:hypothetical protein